MSPVTDRRAVAIGSPDNRTLVCLFDGITLHSAPQKYVFVGKASNGALLVPRHACEVLLEIVQHLNDQPWLIKQIAAQTKKLKIVLDSDALDDVLIRVATVFCRHDLPTRYMRGVEPRPDDFIYGRRRLIQPLAAAY